MGEGYVNFFIGSSILINKHLILNIIKNYIDIVYYINLDATYS